MQTNDLKSYFRKQADAYATYRPGYPAELYTWLSRHAKGHDLAWDVATGNGQAARGLAESFDAVVATDVSPEQLRKAIAPANVTFQQGAAEASHLAAGEVDLVTVATGAHWFDLPEFFAEVKRVCKPHGMLAIWTYDGSNPLHPVRELLHRVNHEILKDDWSPRVAIALNGYADIEFPFGEIEVPEFKHVTHWRLEDILGFVESWSATQRYIARTGKHPVDPYLYQTFLDVWGQTSTCEVEWTITMRAGYVD